MQAPDSATAQDSGKGFDPHPEGQHAVLCLDVVNLGKKLESYQGEPSCESPKVSLVFASGERNEDQSLMLVTMEMTLSASEKANLRKFVESWRGKSYTDEQVEEGLPIHKLQGQPALISVEHILTKKKKRKFAKIASIAPLPKAMPAPDKALLEEYVRPKFLEDKKAEYAKQVAAYRAESGVREEAEMQRDDDPDDLPFR